MRTATHLLSLLLSEIRLNFTGRASSINFVAIVVVVFYIILITYFNKFTYSVFVVVFAVVVYLFG